MVTASYGRLRQFAVTASRALPLPFHPIVTYFHDFCTKIRTGFLHFTGFFAFFRWQTAFRRKDLSFMPRTDCEEKANSPVFLLIFYEFYRIYI